MKQLSDNVYRDGKLIYTANLAKGSRVYGEKIVQKNGVELREWDPTRSKLGAALLNGLKDQSLKEGSVVLYLGASTGTTISHVSDIVKENGIVYSIEFAERVFRSLPGLAEKRRNIVPIMADARKPETYAWIEQADMVFCDVSQPDETQITIRNAKEFLKEGGIIMISVKSQSIDVTKKPEQVFKEEAAKLEEAGYDILQVVDLEPYEEKHVLIVAMK